jgi:hypothetical protein
VISKRFSVLGSMAFLLLGCGDGDSISPTGVPDVAGTYHGEFTVTASSAAANQSVGAFPATATISQQKSNLSIVIVPPEGGALTFSGTIADGGATTLDSEAGLMFLEGELPQCSFTEAEATNKAFPVGGGLILTADIVNAACPWAQAGGDFLATTLSVRFEGTGAGAP